VAITPPPELSAYPSLLTYDEISQTFDVDFLASTEHWDLIGSSLEVQVTATLELPLGATATEYPYDRTILTQTFVWKLDLLTPCATTTLSKEVLEDVSVFVAVEGTQGFAFTQEIPVFKDELADQYDTNGVGCGGQTLEIRVDGDLVQTQSWITETISGSFAAEDHLTLLEFASSGEVTPGDYSFSVVATMDDYPDKQVESTFKVYLANVEMDSIDDETLEVGDPEISREFETRVTPVEMDALLRKNKTMQWKRKDDLLVALPEFIKFNEEDFSVKI